MIDSQNKIHFDLNNENFTAIITNVETQRSDFFIPRYASEKYIITKIGSCCFLDKKNIRNVIFANNSEIHTFGPQAFSGTSLEYISIPSRVERIESNCFSRCEKLKIIDIPEDSNLIYLGDSIFYKTSIECLTIPANVNKISHSLFLATSKLNNITISPKNNFFSYYKNDMMIGKNNENDSEFTNLIFVRRNIIEITIPSFITKIHSYAFDFCSRLKSIEFENDSHLVSINDHAFNCSSLKSISFPVSYDNFKISVFKDFNTIEFLGNSIRGDFDEILGKSNLLLVSFPNCSQLSFWYVNYTQITFYICANASINAHQIIVWCD